MIKPAITVLFSVMVASTTQAEIFVESFDDLPDYTSSEPLELDGWTHRRNGEDIWSPSTGFGSHHDAFEILDSNSKMARGGTGKAFVGWRESYDLGWKNWNSDGILAKYFEEGYEQLYVRFWLRFSPEFTHSGQSKLFRISSWDGDGSIFGYGQDRDNAPVLFWDYSHGSYGLRNFVALRGHPQETNYYMRNPAPTDMPRNFTNGDLSLNFDNNIRDLDGDGVDENTRNLLQNLETGEVLSGGIVHHNEVYGDGWTKVEFFVKMNSGPGVMDGVLMQWINGTLVFKNLGLPWMGIDSEGDRKFNVVGFGGNDFFRTFENSDTHEEWYAIDDILIAKDIPVAPLPPTNVTKQFNN